MTLIRRWRSPGKSRHKSTAIARGRLRLSLKPIFAQMGLDRNSASYAALSARQRRAAPHRNLETPECLKLAQIRLSRVDSPPK